MTEKEMDDLDLEALVRYALWDDVGFEKLTEGPRQRRSLLSRLLDKKSSGLLRERIIAKILGIEHNTRMHSTTAGITTYDGTMLSTGDHYEIKAEEHTTNNPDRSRQSGQITGTGVFSTMCSQAHLDKLASDNPMIAHGMFGDGRLLSLTTFRLMDTSAFDRIAKYCLGTTSTEPRYALSNWFDYNNTIHFVADKWPAHIAPKTRKRFQARWLQLNLLRDAQNAVNIPEQAECCDQTTKNHPSL